MNRWKGYSLIELIIFIIVIAIALVAILGTLSQALQNTPKMHQTNVATEAASRCMEWYLGQRYINGYGSITCPSTTTPTFCTVPAGYTIATDVACTTRYGEPTANYKTITVTVGGKADATISSVIADY